MTKFKLGHRTCPEPYPHCHAPWLLHHRDTKGRMPTAWLWVPPCSLSLLTNYFPGAPHGRMGCHPLDMWGAHLLSWKAVRERLVVEPPAAKLSTNSPGGRAPGEAGGAERAGGSTQPSLRLGKVLCGLCCPFSSLLLPPQGHFLDSWEEGGLRVQGLPWGTRRHEFSLLSPGISHMANHWAAISFDPTANSE